MRGATAVQRRRGRTEARRCAILDRMAPESFEVRPFPRARHDIVDALEVGVRRHMVHALLELDVTLAHDLVDGAPAARFARRLRELVEQAEVLRDRREG
jgi:hypothetical protein